MASPGEMVKAVAAVLGIPEAQVVQHDRNLAVAGLRTVGGRGRSAAKMTPLDAANLLIGVAASSMVKETVEVVNDYAGLLSSPDTLSDETLWAAAEALPEIPYNPPRTWTPWKLDGFSIPALQELPAKHTFRDALVALIEAASDGTLGEAVKKLQDFPEYHHWGIFVSLRGPYATLAEIEVTWNFEEKEKHNYSYPMPDNFQELDERLEAAYNDPPVYGDLFQTRMFSERTIIALGALLKA